LGCIPPSRFTCASIAFAQLNHRVSPRLGTRFGTSTGDTNLLPPRGPTERRPTRWGEIGSPCLGCLLRQPDRHGAGTGSALALGPPMTVRRRCANDMRPVDALFTYASTGKTLRGGEAAAQRSRSRSRSKEPICLRVPRVVGRTARVRFLGSVLLRRRLLSRRCVGVLYWTQGRLREQARHSLPGCASTSARSARLDHPLEGG
jgi:hypothetical protein